MDIAEFKTVVAGYMLRQKDALTYLDQDILLFAINNAKKLAQRKYNFERCKTTVGFVFPPEGIDLWSTPFGYTAPTFYPLSRIKLVNEAWIGVNGTTVGTCGCNGGAYFPIDVVSRKALVGEMERRNNLSAYSGDARFDYRQYNGRCEDVRLVTYGNHAFLYPQPTAQVEVLLNIVQWLPDYNMLDAVDEKGCANPLSHRTDFFLDFCTDYMLYATVRELNFFLKDDERVVIPKHLVDETWQSMINWDSLQGDAMERNNNLD